MMKKTLVIFFLTCSFAFGIPKDSLRISLEKITQNAKGIVGVAVIDVETSDTLTVNNNHHYPMQSVFKFPLAFTFLARIDESKFSFEQKIFVKKSDLLSDTWSPLRDKYPGGDVYIPIEEIITSTVTVSDNNGCDILFNLLGGPEKVNEYMHSIGINDISIVATESEMHKEWNVQYSNWCTPLAMGKLLQLLEKGNFLSEKSKTYLISTMEKTSTGVDRIKGLLPAGTVVAHKTGSSSTNSDGITAATNDVGLLTLPNGKKIALAVFVSDSTDDGKTRDSVIAEIAKAVWEYYVNLN